MALVLPDAMPDIRQYLRSDPTLNPLHGGRVFFRLPDKITVKQQPFIRIFRSGGGVQSGSEAPLMDLRVNIQAWVLDGRMYDTLRVLCTAIESVLQVAVPGTVMGSNGTVLKNVEVTTGFDSVDPDTGWPRYIMDTVWTVSL